MTEKVSVLLVDDEAPVHYALGFILRSAGYLVGYAADGAAGLRMFNESPWNVVITDRAMPEMDGEQLAEQIKRTSPETPVILITGRFKPDTRLDLFDEVLLKPFSKHDLLGAVTKALEKLSRN